jgi:putative phosphoribosyl transferase
MVEQGRHQGQVFPDREEAGRRLAALLATQPLEPPILVLGLPRGGVPIAVAIGQALGVPVDVLVVRKLGAPFNPELAVGAMALGGVVVYNEELLAQLGLDEESLAPLREREKVELERRERAYRGSRPPPAIAGKTVILADDGIATGATMAAAAAAVRKLAPREIVVAAPTCAVDAARRLRRIADRVLVLATPEPYIAVGAWYERFDQLTDGQVVELLSSGGETAGDA